MDVIKELEKLKSNNKEINQIIQEAIEKIKKLALQENKLIKKFFIKN